MHLQHWFIRETLITSYRVPMMLAASIVYNEKQHINLKDSLAFKIFDSSSALQFIRTFWSQIDNMSFFFSVHMSCQDLLGLNKSQICMKSWIYFKRCRKSDWSCDSLLFTHPCVNSKMNMKKWVSLFIYIKGQHPNMDQTNQKGGGANKITLNILERTMKQSSGMVQNKSIRWNTTWEGAICTQVYHMRVE